MEHPERTAAPSLTAQCPEQPKQMPVPRNLDCIGKALLSHDALLWKTLVAVH